MRTFGFAISSPDGTLFDGEVRKITLRGVAGELAIMSGHAPLVTATVRGRIKLVMPDGSERYAESDGGLIAVKNGSVKFMSGSVKWV